MKVPFIDIHTENNALKTELFQAFTDVFGDSAFCGGKYVSLFESEFCSVQGSKYAVGVNSGTSALHLALWSLGVGPGDEVILPSYTFIATAEAVSLAGAKPVFVDIDPSNFGILPTEIEKNITSKTKAIIAVHLYGMPCNIKKIAEIAKINKLFLIEDCAQSHLAKYSGKNVGNFGDVGTFSFYPTKNLGTLGEGGMLVVKDEKLANKLQMLKNHGADTKYQHSFIGHNYRLEGLQAAFLRVKLPHLKHWTEKRVKIAEHYQKGLQDISQITFPKAPKNVDFSYNTFPILLDKKRDLVNYLNDCNVLTSEHYQMPIHKQTAYYSPNLNLPKCERVAKQILCLPLFPNLSLEKVEYVIEKIRTFFGNIAKPV